MRVQLIEVTQPIGTFYISAVPADVIVNVCIVARRQYDPSSHSSGGGVQRPLSEKRVKEITAYTEDPDATFPTPIIVAVADDAKFEILDGWLEFDENSTLGEVIDGQHRVEGLRKSTRISEFVLPVIFMFNMAEEQKAYVFSIINSKQTSVPKSLIFDLFKLSENRSPQKTCHEVARLMNSDSESPFYQRLKMLGNKAHDTASLSQGSFIKYLLPLVSKRPDEDLIDLKRGRKPQPDQTLPLRYYFIHEEDEAIYRILRNVFNAVRAVFPDEWANPARYILTKTVGYGAMMGALPVLIKEGAEEHNLTEEFFVKRMREFKHRLESRKLTLTSEHFPSNAQQLKYLRDLIANVEG